MNDRIAFLINPRSGGRRARQVLESLRSHCNRASRQDFTIEELSRDGMSAQLERVAGARAIVIGGGDGTVSTVVSQLVPGQSRIGVLPLGTGNDLARELALAGRVPMNDPAALVEFYRNGPTRELTLYELHHGDNYEQRAPFVNYVSFGFDARVVADFARWRDNWNSSILHSVWRNRAAYALACAANLGHGILGAGPVEIEGEDLRHEQAACRSLLFANIKSVMGLGISNRVGSPFDDRIECLVVNRVTDYLGMMAGCVVPYVRPLLLGSRPAWEMRRLPAGVQIQMDGESRPDIAGERFRIQPRGSMQFIIGRMPE
jgi:diacylglycerol kinase family enzyme